jgi:hypothetical protein
MAEEVRFELTRRYSRLTIFKTVAFNRSATLPDWSELQDSNLRPSAPKADALPNCAKLGWCPLTESNRQPTDYKSVALPIVLNGQRNVLVDW